MRTTCGYDLEETKFKLIAEQPLSPTLDEQRQRATLHNALLEYGFESITAPNDNGIAWTIRQVDWFAGF